MPSRPDRPFSDLDTPEILELLELGTDGTWSYSPDEDRVVWSPALRRLLGRDLTDDGLEEAIAITHPDDRDALRRAVANAFERGGAYRIDVRLEHRDGHFVPCSVRGAARLAEGGRPARLYGVVLERIDEARAREDLERSEQRFRAFMDRCPAAVFIKDDRGRHLYANDAALAIAGQPREALIGRSTEEIFAPDLAARLTFADREALARSEPVEGRFEIDAPDGTRRHVVDVKFAVPALGSRPATLVGGFAFDVTETVEQERRLRELDRERQERARLDSIGLLAGGIAHDFNNLLLAIRGSVELALGEPERDERGALLGAVIERAEYASALCRRLLTYAGRGETEPTRLDPRALLEDSRELDEIARRRDVRLERAYAPELPELVADALQLRQVLLNLVTNSVEASVGRPDPEVRVECHHRRVPGPSPLRHDWTEPRPDDSGYVCFAVEDRGAGMSQETARRAFEPFFSRRAGGSGLGLATVLGIVRRHRGAIGIDTERGRGTRIEIALPASPSADVRAGGAETEPRGALADRRLLVVDDEAAVCRTVARLLERLGARVDRFEDAEEALRHLDEAPAGRRPDAALLDLRMPGMDGLTLAARIEGRFPGTPILLSSGAPEEDLELAAEHHGFLQKPYSLDRLRTALETLLRPR